MDLDVDEIDSPIGTLTLVASEAAIVALSFSPPDPALPARHGAASLRPRADPRGFSSGVRAYLAGHIEALSDLPVAPAGTLFQHEVWAAVRAIPPGATRSYGEIAAAIGKPAASRAVGLANARNPVGLIIPCHRVVGATGALTGYAAGIERKRWLLAHEASRAATPGPLSLFPVASLRAR